MIRSLHVALTFMTTLPLPYVKDWQQEDSRGSVRAYPLVGVVVGLVLVLVYGFTLALPDAVQAVLLLAAWLGITGALHFDGFCDLADAVFASKSPEERQKIAKDVSVGAFALAAGVLLLLLKVATLFSLTSFIWLLMIPVLSRTLVLLPISLFKVSSSSFLGQTVKSRLADVYLPLLGGCAGFLMFGFLAELLLASFSVLVVTMMFVLLLAFWLGKRMDGLSGDAYGAIIESSEAFMLVMVSAL